MATVASTYTQERHLERVLVTGSFGQSLGGMGAIALSILGLVGVEQSVMAAVSAIVIGLGMLFEAGAFAAEYSGILSRTRNSLEDRLQWGGGLSIEALAGAAAVTLGILSLLFIDPMLLMPIAAITLGGGLILSCTTPWLINRVNLEMPENRRQAETLIGLAALTAATMLQGLMGLGALTLGILALVGIQSMLLTLIAMLLVGASTFLSGAAIRGRMVSAYSASSQSGPYSPLPRSY